MKEECFQNLLQKVTLFWICLFLHLSMNADDEGFINNCKRLMRVIGASDCDFQALIEKAFVIRFESGICVIKHWKINNS